MITRLRPGERLMDARRRLDQALEAGAPAAQQAQGDAHGRAKVGLPDSPFLTMAEGARLARFDGCKNPARAFQKWLVRKAAPVIAGRGKLLIDRDVLFSLLKG